MGLYESLVRRVTFPFVSSRDGLGATQEQLAFLRDSETWSADRLHAYQVERAKAILLHAGAHSPFYRERFAAAGFDPAAFSSLDDLRRVPPLTKTDLQQHSESMIAETVSRDEIHQGATGGSTGTHTPFFRDNAVLPFRKAVEYRGNGWAGWEVGDKIGYYWPAVQDFAEASSWTARVRRSLSYRDHVFLSGRLDEALMERHYAELARFRPKLLRVFPNPFSIFAKFVRSSGKSPVHIPAVISVGEPLLDSQRQLFQDVFGAEVFNCYVSRECGNLAMECGEHDGLHMVGESVHLEFDSQGEAAGAAGAAHPEPAPILITDLVNRGMPLIRYRIDDMGSPVVGACRCGRASPRMSMDAGRASDFLISPADGSRVSGASVLHHMIAEGPEVGQIQITQDARDHLVLRIRKSAGFTPDRLKHVEGVIERLFQGEMRYDITFVEAIPREKSGKYFFTKCLVGEPD